MTDSLFPSEEVIFMRHELRVLGPVFLVLLAGYLATSFSDRDFSLSFSSLTGGVITDQSGAQACAADHILFRVSGPGNAHAALASQTQYTYAVCWDGQGSTQRACNPTSSNLVLRLSDATNAHVNAPLTSPVVQNYPVPVCFGAIQCSVTNRPEQGSCSANLGPTWRCVASLSSSLNAHVSECGVYDLELCCSDGSTSGGGQYRPDTDSDGVFDIGLGALRNVPCNPRLHDDFTQCADNCIQDPNAQQEDQDGDGAGDVCDAFVADSCSIRVVNDNCPHLQECRNLAAQWTSTPVLEGDSAGLTVTGSAECSDKIAFFQVFDKDNRNLLLASPQPATFTTASGTTSSSSSWIAQYFPSESNQYSFQVTVTGGSSNVQASSSQTALLTVSARPLTRCGNNIVEGSAGEQCDDNNTINGDGCSSTCRFEGNFTGGRSCQDDPLCSGVPATFMVCQSDPTQAYFCLTGSNGCKQLSNPLACDNNNNVQKVCVRGADSCKSPFCNSQYTKSPCTGGQQTISCSATGGSHCSCAGYPKTISCTMPDQEESFPVFTGANIVVTILLLMLFYTFKRGARWKSK